MDADIGETTQTDWSGTGLPIRAIQAVAATRRDRANAPRGCTASRIESAMIVKVGKLPPDARYLCPVDRRAFAFAGDSPNNAPPLPERGQGQGRAS